MLGQIVLGLCCHGSVEHAIDSERTQAAGTQYAGHKQTLGEMLAVTMEQGGSRVGAGWEHPWVSHYAPLSKSLTFVSTEKGHRLLRILAVGRY